MWNKEETLKMLEYSDHILEIIDHLDEFTRGNLQAAIEATVMHIMVDERKRWETKTKK